MKKNGMTIIESVIAIALLGLIFLLVAPLINSFGKVKNRVKTQKQIDAEFSLVNEFIQKKVKGAKSTDGSGEYAKVFDSLSDFPGTPITSQDGSVLYLEIPKESGTPDGIFFSFEKKDPGDMNPSILTYREELGGTRELLMEEVASATFKFQEGIILYYIDLNIGEYEGKLRSSFKGSASTRIDIDYD